MTRPRNPLSDDELIRLVGEVLDEDEPLPLGAVEFARQAFVWRDVNIELAELLHDSLLEELVEVRDGSAVRMVVFQSGDVIVDLEHEGGQLRGAVSPPAQYRLQVHHARGPATDAEGMGTQPPTVALTDDTGMFELAGSTEGSVRIVVIDDSGTIALVSPWLTL